jgi:methionine biosynthesis protein MetW
VTEKFTVTLPTGEEIRFPVGWRQQTAFELVTPGRALLDAGCGRGGVAAALAPRFQRVAGIDGNAEVLAVAESRGVEVHRANLDGEPLPFADGSFDAVVCLEVIEHVAAPDLLTRELARVLEPGGRLYLSTPNVRQGRYLVDLVVHGRFPLTSSDPAAGFRGGHLHPFTRRDLDAVLRSAGFDRVEHHSLPSRTRVPAFARDFTGAGLFAVGVRGAHLPAAPVAVREPRSE